MANAEKMLPREKLRNTVEYGAIIAGILGIVGILALSPVASGALIGVPVFERWSRRKPKSGDSGHH